MPKFRYKIGKSKGISGNKLKRGKYRKGFIWISAIPGNPYNDLFLLYAHVVE